MTNIKKATVYSECAVELRARAEWVDATGVAFWEEIEEAHPVRISIGPDTYSYEDLSAKIGQDAADWLIDQLVGDYDRIEWEAS